MSNSSIIAPQQVVELLSSGDSSYAYLDVRAENEFAEARISGFVNAPILNNEERHLVGTCYKQEGQQAAFDLGYQLTAPHKTQRVDHWQSIAAGRPLIVCCWRGGARSRLACEWLNDVGVVTYRVRGGYKSMRQLLRTRLEQPMALRVLSGSTGSGKTTLLRDLNIKKIDLEALANHRGSAFGQCGAQPSQTQFENDIALALWRIEQTYLIEDESRLIGKLELPLALKSAMVKAPVLLLEEAFDRRVQHIFDEYVCEPLSHGCDAASLHQTLLNNLTRISKKLGDARYRQLSTALALAFNQPSATLSLHREWIEPLLREYYDRLYDYSFKKYAREIIAQGDADALRKFLQG